MITVGSKQKFEGFTLVYLITGEWEILAPETNAYLHEASFKECLKWITELKQWMHEEKV